MKFKLSLSTLVNLVPVVTSIVSGVQQAFGKGTPGADRAKYAQAALKDALNLAEEFTGKDLVNQGNVETLVARAIEAGYQIVQLEKEVVAIHAQLKGLKGTGAPLSL